MKLKTKMLVCMALVCAFFMLALVERAGATMRQIVGSVRDVAETIGQISNASRAQTAGIEQISHSIGQIDQVTRQNAAPAGRPGAVALL